MQCGWVDRIVCQLCSALSNSAIKIVLHSDMLYTAIVKSNSILHTDVCFMLEMQGFFVRISYLVVFRITHEVISCGSIQEDASVNT